MFRVHDIELHWWVVLVAEGRQEQKRLREAHNIKVALSHFTSGTKTSLEFGETTAEQ